MIDDDGTDDEDIGNDFGDDTAFAGGSTLLPERSPSLVEHYKSCNSSSCAPSPPKKPFTKFPDNYLADAHKNWTKQRERTASPQLCPPELAIEMSPWLKITSVMAQKRKIKNKRVLQKFEDTQNALQTPAFLTKMP